MEEPKTTKKMNMPTLKQLLEVIKMGRIRHYLATDWAVITSFHPFIYTAKMEMMRTLSNYLWVFFGIFCKKKMNKNAEKYNLWHHESCNQCFHALGSARKEALRIIGEFQIKNTTSLFVVAAMDDQVKFSCFTKLVA